MRCRATTLAGNQCTNDAILEQLCINHFFKKQRCGKDEAGKIQGDLEKDRFRFGRYRAD